MDDDDSWLRRNDSFIPMSGVMQPTNSYVCNPTVSLGEIPNAREDFRTPMKRIRGEMQIMLVSYPYSLVFVLVCSLFFTTYNIL
jgi:hypothetical protein